MMGSSDRKWAFGKVFSVPDQRWWLHRVGRVPFSFEKQDFNLKPTLVLPAE